MEGISEEVGFFLKVIMKHFLIDFVHEHLIFSISWVGSLAAIKSNVEGISEEVGFFLKVIMKHF